MVASAGGAIEILLAHDATRGLALPRASLPEWVEALRQVLADRGRLRHMAAAGRAWGQRHQAGSHFRRLRDLYEQVLAAGTSPRQS